MQRRGKVWIALAIAMPVLTAWSAAPVELSGAWHAVEYQLDDGTVHPLAGTIFFGERRWQVLFFVLDGAGVPRRGSAEGGTYAVDGDALTFRHEHNLSGGEAMQGLPESPLRMVVRTPEDAEGEPTRITVQGDRLTIFFPSGNRMRFDRAS